MLPVVGGDPGIYDHRRVGDEILVHDAALADRRSSRRSSTRRTSPWRAASRWRSLEASERRATAPLDAIPGTACTACRRDGTVPREFPAQRETAPPALYPTDLQLLGMTIADVHRSRGRLWRSRPQWARATRPGNLGARRVHARPARAPRTPSRWRQHRGPNLCEAAPTRSSRSSRVHPPERKRQQESLGGRSQPRRPPLSRVSPWAVADRVEAGCALQRPSPRIVAPLVVSWAYRRPPT
jgi:hypothetical protein